jgi:hypothetical protein
MGNKKSSTCQDKAHEYTPCDSSFIGGADFENSKDVSISGILIPNNELQKFKDLYFDYDYTLIKHDENHYFAYDFVSFKEKQTKVLAQGIAEINAVKPLTYVAFDYQKKAKHQKPAAQKKNETNKRRNKNKSRKQRKKF